MTVLAAHLYALIAAGIVGFQVAAVLGAPVGRLTQGGRRTGRLDATGRVLAALSGVLIAAMALAVRGAAGLPPAWPGWTAWAALAVTALSFAANLATPSRAERRLWAPVTGVMLAAGLVVVLT